MSFQSLLPEHGSNARLEENSAESTNLRWFALTVRSKHEHVSAQHLQHRGYQEFSPTYKAEVRWSDRKKSTERFLFPGYVFCRFNVNDRLPVLTVPGVVGVVGFGNRPAPISDLEIERVRVMAESGLLITPWPFLEVGQSVVLERGPLAGLEGILTEVKGALRLVVSISMLRRSVSAEVERSWVRPV